MLRLTLRARLALSFVAAGLVVGALLWLNDDLARRASAQLDATLTTQVRPLVSVNVLLGRLHRVRELETETARLTDVFAVSDQLELLQAESAVFEHELLAFASQLRSRTPADAATLVEQWQRYQASLQRFAGETKAMNMAQAQYLATYESSPRFRGIARSLRQVVEETEARARAAVADATARHERQRRLVLGTSALGLGLLAVLLGLLARSVGGRVTALRDAARRVAEGRGGPGPAAQGSDELTELALSFESMRQQVLAREHALRAAHEELEIRVATRTAELHEANAQLQREVEERRRAEARLSHQAQYDGLTGLPNRMLAMDRLGQALRSAQRDGTRVAVAFVDLDDFKRVNDTLGHATGDELLVQAATRLRQAVRADDTVARLGGDEFLVVLSGLDSVVAATPVTEKILRAFATVFPLGEHELVVTPSIGLAVYPDDGTEPGILLRNADLAMYEAKDAGRNACRAYNRLVHESSIERLGIERRLRGALANGELQLFYQPILRAGSRELVGAEALLRWHSPELGALAPDQFIPLAEHTGLIVEIGEWVLQQACTQLAAWHAMGHAGLHMAVNVSPRQFRSANLVASVRQALQSRRIAPSHLQIEVTESLLMSRQVELLDTLNELTAMGVALAMDDFGTGYSSLSYLKRFPFDALKVDREFIRDLAADPEDRALVSAAIRMGKGLGLTVVAEGVERLDQLALLEDEGCDLVQGYLFDAPLEAPRFEARWLGSDARAPAMPA